MAANAPVYCVNHPHTETLLRCNRCGKPVCLKCVERTPVGYRCKECLNVQQSGYYTATPLDYALAAGAGLVTSIIAGAISVAIGFFLLFAFFYAPVAGGLVAEAIRLVIQKRRGRYLWLVGCASVVLGGAVGAALFGLFRTGTGGAGLLLILQRPMLIPALAAGALFNLGFLIYVVLAVSTVYARLR